MRYTGDMVPYSLGLAQPSGLKTLRGGVYMKRQPNLMSGFHEQQLIFELLKEVHTVAIGVPVEPLVKKVFIPFLLSKLDKNASG